MTDIETDEIIISRIVAGLTNAAYRFKTEPITPALWHEFAEYLKSNYKLVDKIAREKEKQNER